MKIYEYLTLCNKDLDVDFTDTVFDVLLSVYGFGLVEQEEPLTDYYALCSYEIFKRVDIVEFFSGTYATVMGDFSKFIEENLFIFKQFIIEYIEEGAVDINDDGDVIYFVLRLFDNVFSGNFPESGCKRLFELIKGVKNE